MARTSGKEGGGLGVGGGKVAGKEAQKERTADGTETDVGKETEGLTMEE